MEAPYDPTPFGPLDERVRLRRKRDRGSHDRAVIDAILEEGLLCHLAVVHDGQPVAIPTLYARSGDDVYFHGSAASRTLLAAGEGVPLSLTVSLIDGLVLARSAMHHSANYRSVVLMGRARLLEDYEERIVGLRAIVEHALPGRWQEVRPPRKNELKATAVLALPIDAASAKVRTGPPIDDEEDHALDAWAGVIPLRLQAGTPLAEQRLRAGIPVPDVAARYARPGKP
jgi:uncharacterized protein